MSNLRKPPPRPDLLIAEYHRLARVLDERKEVFDRRIMRIESKHERLELWRDFLDTNAVDLARHIQVEQQIERLMHE